MFYMHHSEVDRHWAGWQRNHPNERPTLEPPWNVMSPYHDTVDSLMDIHRLGYRYDRLP